MNRTSTTARTAIALGAAATLALGACGSDDSGPPRSAGAKVPELQGLTLRKAESRLQARKIVWGLDADGTVYSTAKSSTGGENRAKASWKVVRQTPAAGKRLTSDGSDSVLLTVRR